MAYPPITTLPPAPIRGVDVGTVFSNKTDALLAALAQFVTDTNGMGAYLDALSAAIDEDVLAAAASATSAANSASSAQSASNFAGEWSTLTGALNTPATVYHNGAFWLLLNNLADVTLSEPGVTSDWLFSNGNRWSPLVTASTTINPNQLMPIYATVAVDITQPSFAAGDFVIIHNSPSSTAQVRLLNPSNTITGIYGTISAGDNAIIGAGETVHIYARTSSILEII